MSDMGWRARVHEIVFEADTPAGRAFDVALLASIVISVIAVLLESVASVRASHGPLLRAAEWFFTILFTLEYLLRLIVIGRPWRYAISTFGIIDLLAILPTYLSLAFVGSQSLLVIRALRLLRVFRVLKMVHFVGEAALLRTAIKASARKITVFISFILMVVLIMGSVMYLVEGAKNGFVNIPESMYWAIVTMTTVGYGDIAPQTVLGKSIASMLMIMGYGVIAVPTGIVTVELGRAQRKQPITTQSCPSCAAEGHDHDAQFCKICGAAL